MNGEPGGGAVERLFACVLGRGDRAPARGRVAFVCDGVALTWAELDARSLAYAQALRAVGVEPGDRVAMIAGPCLDNIVALLGHYRAGAVHVPINTRYRRAELEHILRDSGARWVAADAPGFEALDQLGALVDELELRRIALDGASSPTASIDLQALDPAPDPVPGPAPALPADDDLALMIYTSGTTGASKGVCHTYASVVGAMQALTDHWAWSDADRQVLALPLFHVHGLCIGTHGALLHGAHTTLLRRFSVEAVHAAFGVGANLFMGVPTMYAMLLDWLEADPARAGALRSARLFTAGSAALSARNFERFERLTGHRILERYGMSETLITLSNPYTPADARTPGSVGQAVPGFEVRLVDEAGGVLRGAGGDESLGEIQVRGVGMMREYWGRPEATRASFVNADDGGAPWFKTGDVARRLAGGQLAIVGRSSVDIIKSGGFKISAREIEEAIMRGGAFDEVAVLGVPDPTWGERIVAAVVPRTSEPQRSAAAWLDVIVAQLSGELADYKRPRAVKVVTAIPKNALGKVQKHRLRDEFGPSEGPAGPGT